MPISDSLNTATHSTPHSWSYLNLYSLYSVRSRHWQTFCHTFLLKDWFSSFKLVFELVGRLMVWILCHFPQTPIHQTPSVFSLWLLLPVIDPLSPVCTLSTFGSWSKALGLLLLQGIRASVLIAYPKAQLSHVIVVVVVCVVSVGQRKQVVFPWKWVFIECVLSPWHCPKHLSCIVSSVLLVLYPHCWR